MRTITGLERLITEADLQKTIKGNIGYLSHSASVTAQFTNGVVELKKVFGKRLTKLFGPQHGFVTDVQDNMIETKHFVHPYFQIPVYSLYSETRIPTDEMLEGLDTLIVDLQDVGTRVYTYISTLTLILEKCHKRAIEIIVLDRPNPVGGEIIEGNVLEEKFQSFVGKLLIPQRHAMTMGEVGHFAMKVKNLDLPYRTITMKNWKRNQFFKDTGLPWVNPSPNLPTMEGAITFVGTVLFEGTNISEARGTTRSLEMAGHPKIEAFEFTDHMNNLLREHNLQEGLIFRPQVFFPMFQKFAGSPCGGVHMHVVNKQMARPWVATQLLCREFYHRLGNDFKWNDKPYEYEHNRLAIDLINGTSDVRIWCEQNRSFDELQNIGKRGHEEFLTIKKSIELYS